MKKLFALEPYAFFFPLGVLFFLWGVGLWVVFAFENTGGYPKEAHSILMTKGFLLSFVNGFLMTAIPKFTHTFSANFLEKITPLILFLGVGLCILMNQLFLGNIIVLVILIHLAVFSGIRFVNRTKNPPSSFIFIGFGILTALLGVCFQILTNLQNDYFSFYELGRKFIHEAFILFLVLGVGSRLAPALFGWSAMPDSPKEKVSDVRFENLIIGVLAIGLFYSYILESRNLISLSYSIRSLIVGIVLVWKWKVYRFPKIKSPITWAIYLAGLSLVLGYFLVALNPINISYYLHIVYIGGITLLTYAIATRVVLVHSKSSLEFEKKKIIYALISIIMLACLTRVTLFMIPQLFKSHLGYSGITLLLAVVTWVIYLLLQLRLPVFKVK